MKWAEVLIVEREQSLSALVGSALNEGGFAS
jgi:hypothetical protein